MRSGNLYRRIIPNFIEQFLKDKPLSVFGDGSQTRSFAYVSDSIEGILRAAFFPETKGEVFNIGNTREITIIYLAKLIMRIIGKNNRIEYVSLPIDDPKRRSPDITKAKNILKWKPKIDIEEGLIEYLDWVIKENEL